MKNRVFILAACLCAMILLQLQCNLISWQGQNLTITVEVQRTGNVDTDGSNYTSNDLVDLAAEIEEAGVDLGGYSIQSTQLMDIQLIVHDLVSGGNATFREFQLSFRRITPPVYKTLFNWVSNNQHNLNTILNAPMTAWNELTIDADGKRTLENYFSADPPPEIILISEIFGFADGPVNFSATVTIKVQVTLTPN